VLQLANYTLLDAYNPGFHRGMSVRGDGGFLTNSLTDALVARSRNSN